MNGTQWVVSQIRVKLEELGLNEQDLKCLAMEISMDAVCKYNEEEVRDAINAIYEEDPNEEGDAAVYDVMYKKLSELKREEEENDV